MSGVGQAEDEGGVSLKATWGLGLKGFLWFAAFALISSFSGWELFIFFGLSYFVEGLQGWTLLARILLAVLGLSLTVCFMFVPQELAAPVLSIGFLLLGTVFFLSTLIGGSRLIVNARGVTFVDLWIPRHRPWAGAGIERTAGVDGKPGLVLITNVPKERRGLRAMLVGFKDEEALQDHYGLPRDELAALLARYRARSLGQ